MQLAIVRRSRPSCWLPGWLCCIGIPIDQEIELAYLSDGRSELIATAIGAFCVPLPLRCTFDTGEPFATLVRRLQATSRSASRLAGLSVADLAQDTRTGSRNHLIGFGYASAMAPERSRHLLMTLERESALVEPFRLHLQCLLGEEGVIVEFHYDRARLSLAAVDCLAEQWLTFLAHATREPGVPVEQLSLLSDAERPRLVDEICSSTASGMPESEGLHELVETQVETRSASSRATPWRNRLDVF